MSKSLRGDTTSQQQQQPATASDQSLARCCPPVRQITAASAMHLTAARPLRPQLHDPLLHCETRPPPCCVRRMQRTFLSFFFVRLSFRLCTSHCGHRMTACCSILGCPPPLLHQTCGKSPLILLSSGPPLLSNAAMAVFAALPCDWLLSALAVQQYAATTAQQSGARGLLCRIHARHRGPLRDIRTLTPHSQLKRCGDRGAERHRSDGLNLSDGLTAPTQSLSRVGERVRSKRGDVCRTSRAVTDFACCCVS